MMFRTTEHEIDVAELESRLIDVGTGARVVFEGVVRDTHRGRGVTDLTYVAYDSMALNEGERLVK